MNSHGLLDELAGVGSAGGAGGLQVPRVANIPRAVIPSLEPFKLTHPVERPPSREDFLIAELERRFVGRAVKYTREDFLREEEHRKERRQELEKSWDLESNPAWERFGFRGAVAKLLYKRGVELVERGLQREGRSLMRKAVRFANCARYAFWEMCAVSLRAQVFHSAGVRGDFLPRVCGAGASGSFFCLFSGDSECRTGVCR